MRLVLGNVRLGRLGLILLALHGLHGVGGGRCGVLCGFWDSAEAGAAFINRDAVVGQEEHAVSSWETREANTLEEPEVLGGRRAVL